MYMSKTHPVYGQIYTILGPGLIKLLTSPPHFLNTQTFSKVRQKVRKKTWHYAPLVTGLGAAAPLAFSLNTGMSISRMLRWYMNQYIYLLPPYSVIASWQVIFALICCLFLLTLLSICDILSITYLLSSQALLPTWGAATMNLMTQ